MGEHRPDARSCEPAAAAEQRRALADNSIRLIRGVDAIADLG
jgi:hypothetical protein